MINYMYFPKNRPLDHLSADVLQCFNTVANQIDSGKYDYHSNRVLAVVGSHLENCGFSVENKLKRIIVSVPVLYGRNGVVEKSFDADGYHHAEGYVVEVEAGRAVVNYQFLKDFFEACTMVGVKNLCIAVRNTYRKSSDFDKVCKFFDALYASGRLGIPLDGLLIIGY